MGQSPAQHARNKLGGAARRRDPEAVENARRDLAAAKLEAHIRQVVDAAPPLSASQRERLAVLLAPAAAEAKPDRGRHARLVSAEAVTRATA